MSKFKIIEVPENPFPNVKLIEYETYPDVRGYFQEVYNKRDFEEIGIECEFVQDNCSYSYTNVARGLHYQLKNPQCKLISVVKGSIIDVVVDIRKDSPTFGKFAQFTLTETNNRMVYVPYKFAHGYLALGAYDNKVMYKCCDYYNAKDSYGISWNSIDFKLPEKVILSEQDKKWPKLNEVNSDLLPPYYHFII